jgi:uncharacterized membrane protein
VFLIVLLSGIASFVVVAVVSVTLLAQTQPSYGGMMGMGGWWGAQATSQSPYAGLMWFLSMIAMAVTVVGGAGLVYTLFRPEPGMVQSQGQVPRVGVEPEKPIVVQLEASKKRDVADAALKMLKPDELRVIEVLRRNDNRYLQKWISKDTGMSRLKTHRVVARLEERNLVVVTKSGNTNEVSLAPWLVGDGEKSG